MGLFNSIFGLIKKPTTVERDSNGGWFFSMFSSKTYYKKLNQKDAYIFNPAVHKSVSLIKNTGSLANFNLYENDKLKVKNFLYTIKPKPNPYQTWTEFVSDYLFWISMGTAYYYKDSGIIEKNRNHYWLDPCNFDNKTKQLFEKLGKKPTSSNKTEIDLKHIIKYNFNGTQTIDIPLKQVVPIHSDLSFNNWYEGRSVLDALEKIVSNSESSLDAKNINLHFVQKFLLFAKNVGADHMAVLNGFTDSNEKNDLKQKALSDEKVLVSGADNIELKRFVEKFKELGLDESFLNDYLLVGLLFDIPLDLLDSWLKGKGLTSQGDSQEKSMVRFIEMCIMPKLQKLTDVMELTMNPNQEVKAEFTHLGFMRVVEREKQESIKLWLENEKLAKEIGLNTEDYGK